MGWTIIVVIAYLPIIFRIHKRLDYLEKEVKRLQGKNELFNKRGLCRRSACVLSGSLAAQYNHTILILF